MNKDKGLHLITSQFPHLKNADVEMNSPKVPSILKNQTFKKKNIFQMKEHISQIKEYVII